LSKCQESPGRFFADPFFIYFQRGVVYFFLQEREKAVEDWTRSLAIHPRWVRSYRLRAEALAELGRFDEAMADFNRAIELDPQLTGAHRERGKLLFYAGQLREAWRDLGVELELNPDDVEAFFYRGSVSYVTPDPIGAVSHYNMVIAAPPGEFTTRVYIRRGVANLQLNNVEQARADLIMASKLEPNHRELPDAVLFFRQIAGENPF
jgi:tetratricopeptide (TPR) repeat protein